jgi:hypothetical protein
LCRTNFVDDILKRKEVVKGDLEELLNEAIHKIKELKVNGIFYDSGIPSEKHATEIEAEIATIISGFETASDLLLTNSSAPLGFTDVLTAALVDFEVDDYTTTSCLDQVHVNYELVYDGDGSLNTIYGEELTL